MVARRGAAGRASRLAPASHPIHRPAGSPPRRLPPVLPALAPLILALAILLPAQQAPLTSLSLRQLANLEITTASQEPQQVWKTPAAIYVITAAMIRRSGATTLPDVLRLAPGVEVAQIDSAHWAVAIRGLNSQFSRYLLVLVDGQSVYTPLHGGVYWDRLNIPLDQIARIEIIRGPGGAVWGANAVNGVINIITKSAAATQGWKASAISGNLDPAVTELRYGGRSGPDLAYRLYATGDLRGGQHDPGQPGSAAAAGGFDRWRVAQGGFRLDWARPDAHLTLEGDAFDGAAGRDVGIASISPPAQTDVFALTSISGADLALAWRRQLGPGSSYSIHAYYRHDYRLGAQYGFNRDAWGLRFTRQRPLPRQQLIWGVGARFEPGMFLQTVPTVNFLPQNRSDSELSAFLQDQIVLAPRRFYLTVGAKLLHNNYAGMELLPTARLLWTPAVHEAFWAAVTRTVRTPSDLDRDLTITGLLRPLPLPVFVRLTGSPHYGAEGVTTYEAGYRHLLTPALYLDIAAFANVYRGLEGFGPGAMAVVNTPPPPHTTLTFAYVNALAGQGYGWEIAPDWRPAGWLEVQGSYSYLRLHLHALPGFQDASTIASYQGSSPENEFTLSAAVTLPRQFALDPDVRYAGALPAQGVPAYVTADVRLAWRPRGAWSFALVGRNLLQPYHAEFGGDPGVMVGIRRSAYLELIWRP